jgi:ribulose-5-phosphate 4-epimerase/fuculose-1-phosphate aldolase
MTEARLRNDLCRLSRSLFERGLSPGSSGNISVRLDDGGWLATPTNACLGFLEPDRISRLDAAARHLSGDKPTKEIPLHAAVYDSSPTSRAVVHLHSTYSVAVSILPELNPANMLPPLTPYQVMRCGAIALVPYHRPGDPAVADAIRALGGRHTSILLANHGPVVAGPSLEAAVFAAEELEECAKLFVLLKDSRPRYLTQPQIDDLVATFGLAPLQTQR